MKKSYYNYIIEYNKTHNLIFNGLSCKGFLISIKNSDKLVQVINEPNTFKYEPAYNPLIEKLKKGGFIVDKDVNELDCIKKFYESNRSNNNHFLLSILTTYNCNFSCWYCTQHHNHEYINSSTVNHIKKCIKHIIEERAIKIFEINWFGREPLLYPDVIIDISDYTKKLCNNNNITFVNGITTNGSLLNLDLVKKIKAVDLFTFQITIDGNKTNHNKIRKCDELLNSFDLICNNIKLLIDWIPQCDITLRFNYTSQNLSTEVIDDINRLFSPFYRNRIEFLPRKVWQENFENISSIKLKDLILKAKDSGYRVNNDYDIHHGMCYGENKNYYTIFQNGCVDKCANIDLSMTRGYFNNDGKIEWSEKIWESENTIFNNKTPCTSCKYLPLCMGPCPVRRRSMKMKNEKFHCMFTNKEHYFTHLIQSYFDSIKSNHNE